MEQQGRLQGAIDVAAAALGGGIATLHGVHIAIARKPFSALRLAPGVGTVSEGVRLVHDGITSLVYAGLQAAIAAAGGAARRAAALTGTEAAEPQPGSLGDLAVAALNGFAGERLERERNPLDSPSDWLKERRRGRHRRPVVLARATCEPLWRGRPFLLRRQPSKTMKADPVSDASAAPSPLAEPSEQATDVPVEGTPSATRRDLQLGRRLFHLVNGVSVATAYALFFTHQQVVHVFGTIACIVYVIDRIRIAYPEAVARRAPWVNRAFVRAEEQVRESAMVPFAIAVLLTIIAVPKVAALVAIYTLAVADPLAAVVGIRFGHRRIAENRTLEGSLSFFAATTAIAALVLSHGTDASAADLAAASATIGLAAAACELLPLRIDDNLTIPIFVGFAAWAIAALFGMRLT